MPDFSSDLLSKLGPIGLLIAYMIARDQLRPFLRAAADTLTAYWRGRRKVDAARLEHSTRNVRLFVEDFQLQRLQLHDQLQAARSDLSAAHNAINALTEELATCRALSEAARVRAAELEAECQRLQLRLLEMQFGQT